LRRIQFIRLAVLARIALAALLALAFSSCAWTPKDRSAAVDDEEGYVPTGSRIPRKVTAGAERSVGTINAQDPHDMMVKPPAATAIPGT
jgi:hypothetical protein